MKLLSRVSVSVFGRVSCLLPHNSHTESQFLVLLHIEGTEKGVVVVVVFDCCLSYSTTTGLPVLDVKSKQAKVPHTNALH